MKKYKHIILLSLVWIITIFAFSIGFSIYGTYIFISRGDSPSGYLIFIFILIFFFSLFFGFISSLPAFIFFAVFSLLVLRTSMNVRRKKVFILVINYIDIIVTCAIAYAIIALSNTHTDPQYSLYPLKNYVLWYPNWFIIIASTVAILRIPIDPKKPLNTNHENI